jgi:hypothetical protein
MAKKISDVNNTGKFPVLFTGETIRLSEDLDIDRNLVSSGNTICPFVQIGQTRLATRTGRRLVTYHHRRHHDRALDLEASNAVFGDSA